MQFLTEHSSFANTTIGKAANSSGTSLSIRMFAASAADKVVTVVEVRCVEG